MWSKVAFVYVLEPLRCLWTFIVCLTELKTVLLELVEPMPLLPDIVLDDLFLHAVDIVHAATECDLAADRPIPDIVLVAFCFPTEAEHLRSVLVILYIIDAVFIIPVIIPAGFKPPPSPLPIFIEPIWPRLSAAAFSTSACLSIEWAPKKLVSDWRR